MKVRFVLAFGLIVGLALVLHPDLASGKPQQPDVIKIGVLNSLMRDLSDAKIETLIPEFENLMFDQSGFKGKVIRFGDVAELGKELNDKAVHIGVFQGFEFAWALQNYPDLKPLLIAVGRQRDLKAFVVVSKEGKLASLADLKGKVLAIPSRCPEHCHLFLERELQAMGVSQKDFFGKVLLPASSEDALDDILRNKIQAVLVDNASLEVYEQVNPGRYARLKILKQAGGFPSACLAYRPGSLDDGTVTKIKKSLIDANNNVRGKEQLALWKIAGFENIPSAYDSMLADMVKRYPAAKAK